MIKINLLPSETVKKRSQADIVFFGLAGGGAIVAIVLLLVGFKYMSLKSVEKKLVIAKEELKKYEDIVKEVERLKIEKDALERRRNIIRSLIDGRLTYPKFLDEFIASIPEGVWINNCQTKSAGDTIEISCDAFSFSNYAIADWMTTLESTKVFSGIELGTITSQEKTDNTTKRKQVILQFKLSCVFRRI